MHQPHIAIGVHSNHEYLSKKESSLSQKFLHIHPNNKVQMCSKAILELCFDEG